MARNQATVALIVAGGSGQRADTGTGLPKQFQAVGGISVLQRAINAFAANPRVGSIRVAIGEGWESTYEGVVTAAPKLRTPAIGGATRQASVRNGLAAFSDISPARVLIHDAARPFVSTGLIDRVLSALDSADAVVPTLPVTNTLKRVADGKVTGTVARDGIEAAETPQGFAFDAIFAAHEKAAREGMTFTDDAAVAEWAGMTVQTVAGDPANTKLTTAADIADANRRLAAEDALRTGDIRVGVGYDIHPLGAGGEIWLGGVAIPHTRGLIGHSDADVVLHALTDAVLGAIGDGDIGAHFPPSDGQWKGASSHQFLEAAVAKVRARGGVIAHLDVTFVGEGPKLAPHREAIRARIAEIAGITIDRVGVKATTNEGLGFIGRGEGSAAHAVATVRLPFSP